MDTLKSADVHAGQLRVLFEEKKGDGERKKGKEGEEKAREYCGARTLDLVDKTVQICTLIVRNNHVKLYEKLGVRTKLTKYMGRRGKSTYSKNKIYRKTLLKL